MEEVRRHTKKGVLSEPLGVRKRGPIITISITVVQAGDLSAGKGTSCIDQQGLLSTGTAVFSIPQKRGRRKNGEEGVLRISKGPLALWVDGTVRRKKKRIKGTSFASKTWELFRNKTTVLYAPSGGRLNKERGRIYLLREGRSIR